MTLSNAWWSTTRDSAGCCGGDSASGVSRLRMPRAGSVHVVQLGRARDAAREPDLAGTEG